jgi:hypothetical protein
MKTKNIVAIVMSMVILTAGIAPNLAKPANAADRDASVRQKNNNMPDDNFRGNDGFRGDRDFRNNRDFRGDRDFRFRDRGFNRFRSHRFFFRGHRFPFLSGSTIFFNPLFFTYYPDFDNICYVNGYFNENNPWCANAFQRAIDNGWVNWQ